MRGFVALTLGICLAGLPAYSAQRVAASQGSGTTHAITMAPVPHRSPHGGEGRGQEQEVEVDVLLARAVGTGSQETYELTADFQGSLTVTVRGAPFTAFAVGSYHESRKPGELRKRQITVRQLDVPFLLRPFTGSVKDLIEKKTELQSDNPATFSGHDIFLLEEQPGGRYVLSGVHRYIVDEAIDRYGGGANKTNIAFRRNIAKWLFTAPTMRPWIVRPGPPYALRTLIDDQGLIYNLELFYDWGQLGSRVSYVVVQGKSVWREIVTDTMTDLSGIGHVEGQMTLTFSNHCLNCRP